MDQTKLLDAVFAEPFLDLEMQGNTARAFAFNPNQPRDEQGQWTGEGGNGQRSWKVQGEDFYLRWDSLADAANEKLGPKGQAVLKQYQTDSGPLNVALRSGGKLDSARLAALDQLFEKADGLEVGVNLWRSVAEPDPAWLDAAEYSVVTDKGYPSTTASLDVVTKFVAMHRDATASAEDPLLVKIRMHAGDKALFVKTGNEMDEEKEVLLPRNSKFVVLGRKKITYDGRSYNALLLESATGGFGA